MFKRANWVRIAEKSAWAPRDSCGEVVFKNKMWIMGGWLPDNQVPNDVWSSEDGVHWTSATLDAPWIHGDLPASLVWQDKIWMMGGWHGGRSPSATASNQVWCSGDGANWECRTRQAPWCPRLGACGVVFNNKIWLMGGVERYFDGDQCLLNDIWVSHDGVSWDLVTEHAPWPPRSCHGVVVHHGRLWVMGGGNYRPTYIGYNDVWSSADGLKWDLETDHAAWSARIWSSALTYKNYMWILGGWSDHPSRNWADVWYSPDGKSWKELKTQHVWSARHEQSAFVFQDKIWIAGGMEWPLLNDVWRLELDADVAEVNAVNR